MKPKISLSILLLLCVFLLQNYSVKAQDWEPCYGKKTYYIPFYVHFRGDEGVPMPNGPNAVYVTPLYTLPYLYPEDFTYCAGILQLIKENSTYGANLLVPDASKEIRFAVTEEDSAFYHCYVQRCIQEQHLSSSGVPSQGDGTTVSDCEKPLSLIDLLRKKEDTLRINGVNVYYWLSPLWTTQIKSGPTEYSSSEWVTMEATDPVYSYQKPYFDNTACVMPWSYKVRNGEENLFNKLSISNKNTTISFTLSDLISARPSDQIIIKVLGNSNGNLNQRVIRFYPELPRVLSSGLPISPIDSLLRKIDFPLSRVPDKNLDEKLTVLTCYKSIKNRPDGVFSISESEIAFQIKLTENNIKNGRLVADIPNNKFLSPGTYYFTVEGTIRGISNRPGSSEVSALSAASQTAMFPCYTIRVFKSDLNISNLAITNPVCYGQKGSMAFKTSIFTSNPGSTTHFVAYINKNGLWEVDTSFHFEYVFPSPGLPYTSVSSNFISPGFNTFRFCMYRNGVLSLQSEITIEIKEPKAIDIPVSKKDISGVVFTNGVPASTGDGWIAFGRSKTCNGTPPYIFIYSENWNAQKTKAFTLTQDTIKTSKPGFVVLTVADQNKCFQNFKVGVNAKQDTLGVQITEEFKISCKSAMDGVLKASLLGNQPSGSVSYTWYKNGTKVGNGEIIGNLGTGTYRVDVVSNINPLKCSFSYFLSEPKILMATNKRTIPVNCYGDLTGVASMSIVGGTPPYGLFWNNGATGSILQNVTAGTYILTVIDKRGCTDTFGMKIAGPAKPLNIVIDSLQHLHYDVSGNLRLGYISAHLSGGTPPLSPVICSNLPSPAANITWGTYPLYGTDSKGCTVDTSISVYFFDKLSCLIEKKHDISCFNGYDGECKLTVLGGRPPYKIKWSNGELDKYYLSSLTAGTYRAKVTDAYGSSLQTDVIFNDPTPLLEDFIRITPPSYRGYMYGKIDSNKNDASLNLGISGGMPPYTYVLAHKENGRVVARTSLPFFSNLSPGLYSLTIADKNNCSITSDINIPKSPNLKALPVISSPVLCSGEAQGRLCAKTEGGKYPYSFLWRLPSGLSCSDSIINKAYSGEYELKVTDADGIVSIATVFLPEPPPLQLSLDNSKNPSYQGCTNGELLDEIADGSISLTLQGGSGKTAWTFFDEDGWALDSNSTTSIFIDSLYGGLYFIIARDLNMCLDTLSMKLKSTPELCATVTQTSTILCNGSKSAILQGNVEGGVPPYSFYWKPDSLAITREKELQNIGAGLYTLFVEDANGIGSSYAFKVDEPDSLSCLLSVHSALCNMPQDGYAEALVNGGIPPYNYTWKWNGVEQDSHNSLLNNLGSGVAEINIIDKNGCTKISSSSLQLPSKLSVSHNIQNVSYSGIVYNNQLSFPQDGIIELNVNGGTPPYSYRWKNTESLNWNIEDTISFLKNLAHGSYVAAIEDANACAHLDTLNVGKEKNLVSKIEIDKIISCYDKYDGVLQAKTLGGTAPYNYTWTRNNSSISGSESKLTNLEEGLYIVCVTDKKGVQSFDSIRLFEPQVLKITGKIENLSGWNGADGSIIASVSGGTVPYSFLWSTSSTDSVIDSLVAGTYNLWIKDSLGCSDMKDFTVNSPDSLQLSNLFIRNCNGNKTFLQEEYSENNNGSIQANIIGGVKPYSHIWLNEKGDTLEFINKDEKSLVSIKNLSSGKYSVFVEDANKYAFMQTFTIELSTELQSVIQVVDPILCKEGRGRIEVLSDGGKPPYSYQWYNKNNSSELLSLKNTTEDIPSGLYGVTVTDVNGNIRKDSFLLREPSELDVKIEITPSSVETDMYDGLISLIACGGTPPYSFSWNNGETDSSITYFCNFDYTAKITDKNGCFTSKDFKFDVPSKIEATIICTKSLICNGDSIGELKVEIKGGKEPYQFIWNTGDTTNIVSNLKTGVYSVMVRDVFGGKSSAKFDLYEPQPLTGTINVIDPSCFNFGNGSLSAEISGGSYPYVYFWSNGQQTMSINSASADTYTLSVLDHNMCAWKDSLIVKQPDYLSAEINIQNPICANSTGSLYASALGGTPPYSYLWSHPQTTQSTGQIATANPGLYHLRVTDLHNCTLDTAILMPTAKILQWNLNEQALLCPYQTLDILPEFLSDTSNLQSFWALPNRSIQWGHKAETSLPGTHKITMIQYGECLYTDSIVVLAVDDTADCHFWISTLLEQGKTGTAVDLSNPASDSSSWILPQGVELIKAEGPYAELLFADTGRFPITLVSYRGLCSQSKTTTVYVVSAEKKQIANFPQTQAFKQAFVAPNPNHGETELFISTLEKTQVDFIVIEASSGKICQKGDIQSLGTDLISYKLSLPSISGTYLLVLKIGSTVKTLKIIVEN